MHVFMATEPTQVGWTLDPLGGFGKTLQRILIALQCSGSTLCDADLTTALFKLARHAKSTSVSEK